MGALVEIFGAGLDQYAKARYRRTGSHGLAEIFDSAVDADGVHADVLLSDFDPDDLPEPEEPLRHQRSSPRAMIDAIEQAAAVTNTDPSDEQKAAGNYRKGKFWWNGYEISIETPEGATRSGKSKDGREWSVTLPAHYGYIRRTESEADGDHLDCFIGPDPESHVVFVVDQQTPGGRFDEHKTMIGYSTEREARQAYLDAYSPGWKGLRSITPMTVDQFCEWLEDGDSGSPIEEQVSRYARMKSGEGQKSLDWDEAEHPRDDEGQFATVEGGHADEAPKTAVEETAADSEPDPEPDPPEPPHETAVSDFELRQGAKWRKLAAGMQKKIDHGYADRLTNTHKRQREAHYARQEARRAEREQKAMEALADAWESGTIPAILEDVKTKDDIARLMRPKTETNSHGDYYDTDGYHDTTERGKALQELSDGRKPENSQDKEVRKRKQQIQEAEEAVRFTKIPGFWATPPKVAEHLIDAADLGDDEELTVLEPSAGKGDLAEAVLKANPNVKVTCIERNRSLAEILKLKQDTAVFEEVIDGDFLETEPDTKYDRVVMNPPFENGQDLEHVQHAFKFLKPGGKLVAIMSASAQFRTQKKYVEFRDWLESHGGVMDPMDAGGFAGSDAFKQTGVNTVMVTVDRGESEQYSKWSEEDHPRADDGKFGEKSRGDGEHKTNSAEFNRWFKDSKVIDEDGEPMVVYHGTSGDFVEFDLSRGGQTYERTETDEGFAFFSSNPETAENVAIDAAQNSGGSINVIPLYLSIQNPLLVNAPTRESLKGTWREYEFQPSVYFDNHAQEITQQMLNGDHDGIIVIGANHDGSNEHLFVIRSANQAKSATGNSGAYDPDDDRITYAKRKPAAGQKGMSWGDEQEHKHPRDESGMFTEGAGSTAVADDDEPFSLQRPNPGQKHWTPEDHAARQQGMFLGSHTDLAGQGDLYGDSDKPAWKDEQEWAELGTEAPAFKRWFGRSQVVDKSGKPRVVYHGTATAIDEFKVGHPQRVDSGWLGDGLYFSSDPELASSYASMKELVMRTGGSPNILPVYLKIERPYVATQREKESLMLAQHRGDKDASKKWTAALKEKGHDGVVLQYDHGNKPTEYVAFEPTQIKSATGNRGSFDPQDPRHSYSKWNESDHPRADDGKFGSGIGDDSETLPKPSRNPPDGDKPTVPLNVKQFGDRWYVMAEHDGHQITRSDVDRAKAMQLATDDLKQLGAEPESEAKPEAQKPPEAAAAQEPVEEPTPPAPSWLRAEAPPAQAPSDKFHGIVKTPDGRYVGATQAAVADLKVDPHRFQYKISGIDPKTGTTVELKEVGRFRPEFAGQLLVWNDPETGEAFVVNGHHRYELARRANYEGSLSVFFIDAKNAGEARAMGAMANMAEGRGTAVDAAKFMRDTGKGPNDLKAEGISLKGQVAANGATLAKLSDNIFRKLTNGMIRESRALSVASELSNHDHQDQLFKWIDGREQKGKPIADDVVREMAREIRETPSREQTKKTLFGDESTDESLFLERNQLKSWLRTQLADQSRAFRAVASEQRKDTLEQSGRNVIDVQGNIAAADQARAALDDFGREVNFRSDISNQINQAAQDLAHDPKNRKAVQSRLLESIRGSLGGQAAVGVDGGAVEAFSRQRAGNAAGRYAREPARIAPSWMVDQMQRAFNARGFNPRRN